MIATPEQAQALDPTSDAIQRVPYLQQMESSGLPTEILTLAFDFEKSLGQLKNKLKGMEAVFDEKTGESCWKATGEPWVNDKGISRILGILRGHVDVNTFLSYLMDDEINEITHNLADEVTTILANKTNDWAIDCAYLGIIQSIIVNTIFIALKRAQGGLTLKQIYESTHRIETHNPQPQQPLGVNKKKFWGAW